MSQTELGQNTRRVLSDVRTGRTALIENYGEREAALLDILDHRILQAVMRYHAEEPEIAPDAGLPDGAVQELDEPDARYGLVFAHYLAGSISMVRAAELLEMPWLELRTRCMRLNIPLRPAPGDAEEAAADTGSTAKR